MFRRMIGLLKSRFDFMRGNILVFTITGSLGMFCRAMVFPYASLYILALGGSSAQIGIVNSLSPLAGLIMFPLSGYLTDRVGRVKLIAAGGYLSAALLLLYVFAPDWRLVALARFLQGFMVFQFPPASAIIADSLSPSRRGVGAATMNTLSGLIAIAAPYVAGSLIEAQGTLLGMRILYGVMLAANVISATLNLLWLKETTTVQAAPSLRLANVFGAIADAYSGIPAMLKQLSPSLKALTAVIVLGFMSNAVAGSFWVVYAREYIRLTPTQWGLILLVETALRIALYIPAGLIADRYGRTRSIVGAIALSGVSIPLFVFASNFAQVLLIRLTLAVANTLFLPACSALVADAVPKTIRGRTMAAIGRGGAMLGAASGGTGGPGVGFLITIPLMLSSLLGGYLYALNPRYPWAFVSIATVVAMGLALAFIRDPQVVQT